MAAVLLADSGQEAAQDSQDFVLERLWLDLVQERLWLDLAQ